MAFDRATGEGFMAPAKGIHHDGAERAGGLGVEEADVMTFGQGVSVLPVAESGGAAVPVTRSVARRHSKTIAVRAYQEHLPRRRSLPAAPLFGCGAGLARLGSHLSRSASPHPAALSVISPAEKEATRKPVRLTRWAHTCMMGGVQLP